MLFVVEERLESLRGGGTQGEGIDDYVYYAKKGCFTQVSQSLIAGYCRFYTKSELLQVSQWLFMNLLAAISCVIFLDCSLIYSLSILFAPNF